MLSTSIFSVLAQDNLESAIFAIMPLPNVTVILDATLYEIMSHYSLVNDSFKLQNIIYNSN